MQRQTVSSKAVRPEAEANVRGSRVVLQEIIICRVRRRGPRSGSASGGCADLHCGTDVIDVSLEIDIELVGFGLGGGLSASEEGVKEIKTRR